MQGTTPPGATVPGLPTILDIEASGFGPGSYPIEVGFVTGDGKAWCSLVRPEADWRHWDDKAAAMHGITREHVEQHGRGVEEIAALGPLDVFVHNAATGVIRASWSTFCCRTSGPRTSRSPPISRFPLPS